MWMPSLVHRRQAGSSVSRTSCVAHRMCPGQPETLPTSVLLHSWARMRVAIPLLPSGHTVVEPTPSPSLARSERSFVAWADPMSIKSGLSDCRASASMDEPRTGAEADSNGAQGPGPVGADSRENRSVLPYPIVGIGASAGGVEALQAFF